MLEASRRDLLAMLPGMLFLAPGAARAALDAYAASGVAAVVELQRQRLGVRRG